MTENKAIERKNFENSAIAAKEAFMLVAPNKWTKEIGFALQILREGESSFKDCDQVSIKNCVINLALTGSTLNPVLKRAYLIPRTVRGKLKCCLEFDYRGLVDIAVKSGSVYDIDATVVYEHDAFHYEMGLNPVLDHVPTLEERGPEIGVYAVATMHHNLKKFIYLPWTEILKIKAFSKAEKSPMWNKFIGEAARKTAVKKLYKLLPQTDEMAVAMTATNEAEGFEFKKDSKEQGGEILKRFAKEEPKDESKEELEIEVVEAEVEPDKEDGEPSTLTLKFNERLKAAKTLEKLDTIFAEYELTKPDGTDLVTMKYVRDQRAQELKKATKKK